VVWLHGDHLGSTSLATDAARAVVSRQLYYPFGEQRWSSAELPTDFQFTGQRIQSTIALYDYHARFYDPYVGRFIQADTIVPSPGNPQHFNRYSYVLNNPLAFTDPGGHRECGPSCEGDTYHPQFDYDGGGGSPEWFLSYMFQVVVEDWSYLLDHPIEKWGLYNIGCVVKHTAARAYHDGAIDHDTFMEWYFGGIAIASNDPETRLFMWSQNDYTLGLGIVFMQFMPSFDAQSWYSNYSTEPGETYKFNLGRGDGEGDTTRFYRAVSIAEYEQIQTTGTFETVPHGADGKYLAGSVEDAMYWGENMYGSGNFRVVQVDYSNAVVNQFWHGELDWRSAWIAPTNLMNWFTDLIQDIQ
jgi:RHS repeat-associated protein